MRVFPGCAECARLHEAWLAVKDEPPVSGPFAPPSWGALFIEVMTHCRWAHDWPPDPPRALDV